MATTARPTVLMETLIGARDTLLRPELPLMRTMTTVYTLYDFPVDGTTLRPDHRVSLDALARTLRRDADTAVVSIVGRASQTGPESHNETLAADRARVVRDHLLAAGVPEQALGPTVSGGSSQPLIDVPGQEAALNRSVEITWTWFHLLDPPPPPPPPPPERSIQWKLGLTWTFALAAGVGFQVQFGELQNLSTGETRPVSAVFLGVDVGVKISIPASATVGVGIDAAGDGIIQFRTPVGWDWFDGRLFWLASAGLAAGGGGSVSTILFWDPPQDSPQWYGVDVGVGFTFTAGALAMAGTMVVGDPATR